MMVAKTRGEENKTAVAMPWYYGILFLCMRITFIKLMSKIDYV